ncbi:MAG: NfeD family protein [Casimicrobiaceae bacterium]
MHSRRFAAARPDAPGARLRQSAGEVTYASLVNPRRPMMDYWIWWVAAALLVGLELVSGTFYLLAVGIAFVVGGFVAWAGASLPAQMLVGGGLAVIAVIVAHHWRKARGAPAPQAPLDRGAAVEVRTWNADGTARVDYRGTQWDAEVVSGSVARVRTMYIVDIRGSTLLLSDTRP